MPLANINKGCGQQYLLIKMFLRPAGQKKVDSKTVGCVVVGTLFSQYGLEEFLKDTATCFSHLTSLLPL